MLGLRSLRTVRLSVTKLRATPVTVAKRFQHIDGIHRNTPDNNPKNKFTFSSENSKTVDEIIAKYPTQYKKAAIMPLLGLGQQQHGYCSIGVMNEVARILEVPPMRVYEVASFYTMFKRKPIGKVDIGVCTNIACMLRGGEEVYEAAKAYLKENNADGYFSLEEVECSGACANAPVAEVNNIYYEDLTPEGMVKTLKDLRAGKGTPGPLDGVRKNCEPYGAKTSLFGDQPFDIKSVTRTDI